MTGRISGIRAALAEALAGVDVEVVEQLPERYAPPVLLLVPADPWIAVQPGVPHRMGEVRFDLTAVARQGINSAVDANLVELIEQVLDAIHGNSNPWLTSAVSAPFDLAAGGGAVHIAARITVTLSARITTD